MRVLFATPCFGHNASMNCVGSLFSLAIDSERLGLKCTLLTYADSLVTRSRFVLVRGFLEEEFTHLFWIDADVGFPTHAAFRLLLADRDVVAGAYPLKAYDWPEKLPPGLTRRQLEVGYLNYPINTNGSGKMRDRVDADGFFEANEVAGGFMCIKRHVLTQMMERYPDLTYVPDEAEHRKNAHLYWRFFDTMVAPDSGRFLSEDYAFCRRWRDIGGKVWVDVTSKLSHSGSHIFEGDLQETLRERGLW